ncbi:iron dicitrate transport regulator FecR [Pseudomonas sp. 10-1B]|uniref:FecR family protein n=1 Tax=Pseudomonas sp. 10-1B TaxID=1546029 RepID=UPI00061FE6BB|nr:FecR family protein [Pseudomonas sp. 10-1B]KIY42001.1 iron dicitrate transport regulator FecR [Pseudomonas sp. 10-1B]
MHKPSAPLEPSPDVRRAAQAWVVRLTSGNVQPGDVEAARAWCALAPEHQQAFVEARRVWALSGQLQAPAHRHAPVRQWALASAAVLVLGVGLALAWHGQWGADYRTGVGERRVVALADGSRISLDAESAVDVEVSAQARRITLRKGEAVFDVAHDPARPFTVQAGEVRATALGTVYAVSREGSAVDVIVKRGRVAVSDASDRVELVAGEAVGQQAGRLGSKHGLDVDSALAWQQGRLVFEQAPLAQVLKALERYRPGWLVIGDEQLRGLKVSGTFQLDRLDEGLATLEQAFALNIRRYSDYLLVFEARD